MGKLIRFEFRKLFKSKYMYICFGIALMFLILALVASIALKEVLEQSGQVVFLPLSGYLAAKSALGVSYTLLVCIFVSIFACEDYSMGTLKNIIGKGYSRMQVLFSKYLTSLIVVLVMAAVNILVGFAIGQIAFGDGDILVEDNVALIFLGQFLVIIASHALYFFVAYSMGRIGPAIAINIVAPTAVTLIFSIIDVVINKSDFSVTYYWIDGILTNLATVKTLEQYIIPGIILSVVYTAIFDGLAILVASKKQY